MAFSKVDENDGTRRSLVLFDQFDRSQL
jgi:hypothetical protein